MEMVPWWNLLPRAVDPQAAQYNALRMAALNQDMQERQQQMRAKNMLAQAIGGGATGSALIGPLAQVDPKAAIALSLQTNESNALRNALGGAGGGSAGAVTGGGGASGFADPMAVTRNALAAGVPADKALQLGRVAGEAAKTNLEITDKNRAIVEKETKAASDFLSSNLSPEYDDNAQRFGKQRADQVYFQHRKQLIDEMKASGQYGAIADHLDPSVPYATMMANAMGIKDYYAQQRAAAKQGESKDSYRGMADGKPVLLSRTADGRFIDPTTGQAPAGLDPASIVKIGTGSGAAAGKPMPAPLDAEVVGADGKIETRPVYREANGQVLDAITNEPIPPDRIKMIRPASAGRPRSAATAFITKYMEEHPDATAEDLANASAGFAAQQGGTRAFLGGGRQGDAVRFIGNVVGDHLPTLDKLGDALGNNDVRALNSLKNTLKTQFGYAGPVNFDAAKAIVSGEITKAVVGGVASMQDRQVLMDDLNRANSPEQLKGVIGTFRMLLAGQLRGLYRQAEVAKVPDAKFRAMLPKSAQEMLDEPGPTGEVVSQPSATAAPAAPAAQPEVPFRGREARPAPGSSSQGVMSLPSDIAAQMKDGDAVNSPDGQHRWAKRNGQIVQVY